MSEDKNKHIDYFKRFCLLMLAVATALIALNFIFPKDVSFTAIDMLSDLREESEVTEGLGSDSAEEEAPAKEEAPKVLPKKLSKRELTAHKKRSEKLRQYIDHHKIKEDNFLAIEDFSKEQNALRTFYKKLKSIKRLGRPLRIAVLGDSFIEGDLFTAPLRKQLQRDFGGLGVGFMGLFSESPAFRKSIKQRFKGWKDKSVLFRKNGVQIITGHKYIAEDGAWVAYKMPNDEACFSEATIYYTATKDISIALKIDGETSTETLPNTDGEMKSYTLYRGEEKQRLRFSVEEGAKELVVYGIALDGQNGITLDNHSLRGASGIQLSGIDPNLSQAFAKLRPYDLIILEYGLNVVSPQRKEYSKYRKQMNIVINKLRHYYPKTDILMLGVSDRDQKASHQLHKNVLALLKVQQEVAQDQHLAFWSIFEAVQQLGGVKKLTSQGLAAKDYTHLSPKGGRVISQKLYHALKAEEKYYE